MALSTAAQPYLGFFALNTTTNSQSERPLPAAGRRAPSDRPWYRWSLVTWLALILMAGAVGFCHWLGPREHEIEYGFDIRPQLLRVDEIDYVGWPFLEIENHDLKPQLGLSSIETWHVSHPLGILGNVFVAALLFVWIVLVLERMDRNSGRSSGPQFLAVGVILGGTALLSRFREPIWNWLVMLLPSEFAVVFEIGTDGRPGWMHMLHYGMSLAIVNALVVVAWYSVVGLGKKISRGPILQEIR